MKDDEFRSKLTEIGALVVDVDNTIWDGQQFPVGILGQLQRLDQLGVQIIINTIKTPLTWDRVDQASDRWLSANARAVVLERGAYAMVSDQVLDFVRNPQAIKTVGDNIDSELQRANGRIYLANGIFITDWPFIPRTVRYYKVNGTNYSDEDYQQTISFLSDYNPFADVVIEPTFCGTVIVTDPLCTKGPALTKLGLDLSRVMAVGDDRTDESMFIAVARAGGLSVSVNPDQLLQGVNYQTLNPYFAGTQEILNDLLKIR